MKQEAELLDPAVLRPRASLARNVASAWTRASWSELATRSKWTRFESARPEVAVPGVLAATQTGLTPAGNDELMLDHLLNKHHPTLGALSELL
jgi:hypothetical protein